MNVEILAAAPRGYVAECPAEAALFPVALERSIMLAKSARLAAELFGRATFWPLLVVAAAMWSGPPAVAQSGTEWHSSQWHLWRINVDGSGLVPLDQTPGSRCGSPVWSPDGKRIVYDVLSDNAGGYQIAVIRPDGTGRRLIGRGSIPSWSPDGKLIVCQSGGTVVMNPDGRGRETILDAGFGLRWSPRGNRIASLGGGGIWLLDLATGSRQTIFSGPYSLFHGFDISPDGRRFCFGSTTSGVGLATLDEKTMRASVRWLVNSGIGYHASWAPDGRRVAFAWQPTSGDLIQIYLMDVDSKEPPTLLPGLDTARHNVNPDWSPDGKTIVFSSPAPL